MMMSSACNQLRPASPATHQSKLTRHGNKPAEGPAFSQQTQPHFAGAANNGLSRAYRKLLNHLDFRAMGTSYLNQIQVIYAACISWRLVAANERRKESPTKSWNEVRENALRDSMGYMFWFFATPMLQRGILSYVTKKYDPGIGNSLCKVNPEIANGKGFWGKIKAWNPLYRIDIPSSEQVKNQKEQALADLNAAKIGATEDAYKKVELFYNKLSKYRNIATGLGLLNTIALIGIGINLFNFYLTRKNMERRKMAMQHPEFPPLPTVPKPPTASSSDGATQTPPPIYQQAIKTPPAYMPSPSLPQPPAYSPNPAFNASLPMQAAAFSGNPWNFQPPAAYSR